MSCNIINKFLKIYLYTKFVILPFFSSLIVYGAVVDLKLIKVNFLIGAVDVTY